jgi:hypothetical protein
MNDRTFNEAKQLYLEQYASAIVTSGYLKIAVALLPWWFLASSC